MLDMSTLRLVTTCGLTVLALLPVQNMMAQTASPALPSSPSSASASQQTALHDRAEGLLNDSLKDKNPDTRKQAVEALGLAGTREPYLSEVVSMLDDKDVERPAGNRCESDGPEEQTHDRRLVQKALNDEVPEVSFAAAKALWTLKDPSGRDALVAVLSGETKTASGFLTRQKREALRMFQTPRTLFTFAFNQGIGLVPVPGLGLGVSSLRGILSDPGVSGRAAAALMLSTDKSPEVMDALRDALTDKDASVRAAGAHASGVAEAIRLLAANLAPLMEDKKEAVRVRAAAGWLRLEGIKASRSTATAKGNTGRQGMPAKQ